MLRLSFAIRNARTLLPTAQESG